MPLKKFHTLFTGEKTVNFLKAIFHLIVLLSMKFCAMEFFGGFFFTVYTFFFTWWKKFNLLTLEIYEKSQIEVKFPLKIIMEKSNRKTRAVTRTTIVYQQLITRLSLRWIVFFDNCYRFTRQTLNGCGFLYRRIGEMNRGHLSWYNSTTPGYWTTAHSAPSHLQVNHAILNRPGYYSFWHASIKLHWSNPALQQRYIRSTGIKYR